MDKSIIESIKAELNGKGNFLAKILNTFAMVKEELGEHSWVGLYLYDSMGKVFNLGPFQGSPACEEIAPGKGVVGACALAKETLYVPDVREFPGYISCDARAKSEAVFPLIDENGNVIGVFDIDHPEYNGLEKDLPILQEIANLIAGIGIN
ncbi:MAG: GAF domain-containing protein [Bacilli bacterium]|nr:GAF domain-containing protein [Bacilli bacterium]